jgi:hypothetical protein
MSYVFYCSAAKARLFRWSNLLKNAFKMSLENGENQLLLDAYNLIYNPWGGFEPIRRV